jgi:general secretion pathway protein A
MYTSYYRLSEKPFQISTDPKFLWLGEKHREALAVLKYSIINNQGFVLLTGDVGTGKTTLINALVNSLDQDTIVAVVSDPKLDRIEFFNLIAKSFKFRKSFKDKLDFTVYFGQFLKAAHKENKKVLLVIDEAQNISLELLEEIRLLSNIEIPEKKLLNIFFVGQNEFNNILMRNECRPLRQRITVTYNIDPLTEAETKEYITHRLKVAGAKNEIFNEKAIRKIYSFSKGYPRLINIICDHALLTGYVKDLTTITPTIIKECTKELSLPGESKSSKTQEVRLPNKKMRRFGKRAVLYSCLLFLLIPLFYPPVSTTLKGYFTNVINFYDQLFQQLTGPAHSYNAQEVGVQEYERASQTTTPPLNQLTNTDSNPSSDDIVKIDKSTGGESSNLGEHSFNLADCKLTIPFGYNSNEVPTTAYDPLEKCASIMMQNPAIVMIIKGYADKAGSYVYNKKLSEFRANIVKSYLVGQGISPTRIETVGMGEKDPLKPNRTAEGRRANRRVEIELVGEQAN